MSSHLLLLIGSIRADDSRPLVSVPCGMLCIWSVMDVLTSRALNDEYIVGLYLGRAVDMHLIVMTNEWQAVPWG